VALETGNLAWIMAKGDERIERLESMLGAGPKIAFVNEERLENGAQVSNYLGLTPGVYMLGSIMRYGDITKRGNGYLRVLLVQGAWTLAWSQGGGALGSDLSI
jgi:transposase